MSLVALVTWRDLLFRAKHLFVEAIVSGMRKSHRCQRRVLAASRGDLPQLRSRPSCSSAERRAVPRPWTDQAALSLGSLRRKVEALMLPDDVRVVQLDGRAERERHRRRAQAQLSRIAQLDQRIALAGHVCTRRKRTCGPQGGSPSLTPSRHRADRNPAAQRTP